MGEIHSSLLFLIILTINIDNLYAIDLLKKYIENIPTLQLAVAETSPLKVLRQSSKDYEPGVGLLKIAMKELSGLELAELLRNKVHIVFTSGHSDYFAKTFDLNAVDYMSKPVTYTHTKHLKASEMAEQKEPAPQQEKESNAYFFIQDTLKRKILRVRYLEIDYIEASLNYVLIECSKQTVMTYSGIKEMEEFLPPETFLRIHKSFIINLEKIVSVVGNIVRMENGNTVPLGKSYRKVFFDQINSKMFKKKCSGS